MIYGFTFFNRRASFCCCLTRRYKSKKSPLVVLQLKHKETGVGKTHCLDDGSAARAGPIVRIILR